jgi:hypothetical protein
MNLESGVAKRIAFWGVAACQDVACLRGKNKMFQRKKRGCVLSN